MQWKAICVCIPLILFSLAASASELKHSQKDCFSGVTKDYDAWRNFIERKNQGKPKQALIMEWFDGQFKREKFDHYKQNLSCHSFIYKVKGENVSGYLIKPKSIDKKLPVIIYNRGGNGNFGVVNFASKMKNVFPYAIENFIVIGSQYSSVAGGSERRKDEFGGEDVYDVIELFNVIEQIEEADSNRIGMIGVSRGGMQNYLTLRHLNKDVPLKAVVSIAAPSDLAKNLEKRKEMEKVHLARIPNYIENKELALKERSVVHWVDELPKNIPQTYT